MRLLTSLVIYFEVITTSRKLLSWSHLYKVKLIHHLFFFWILSQKFKNSFLENSYCPSKFIWGNEWSPKTHFFLSKGLSNCCPFMLYFHFYSLAHLHSCVYRHKSEYLLESDYIELPVIRKKGGTDHKGIIMRRLAGRRSSSRMWSNF